MTMHMVLNSLHTIEEKKIFILKTENYVHWEICFFYDCDTNHWMESVVYAKDAY